MKKYINQLHKTTVIMMMINNVFGLRVFEFPDGHPRLFWSVIYILTINTLYAVTIYFEREFALSFLQQKEEYFFSMFSYVANEIQKVCTTFLGFYFSELYAGFKKKMIYIDESLRKLGASQDGSNPFYSTCIIIILWFLHPIFIWGYYFQSMLKRLTFFTAFFFVVLTASRAFIGTIVFLDFAICIRYIESGFKKTNELLECLMKKLGLKVNYDTDNGEGRKIFPLGGTRPNSVISHINSFENNEIFKKDEGMKDLLQVIRLIHLDLCSASKMICTMFETQLNIQINLGLLFIIGYVYYIYKYVIGQNYSGEVLHVTTVGVLETIALCCKIAFISYLCECATEEGKKALELIHSCSEAEGIDSEMMDEIRQFSLQITQMDFRFTKSYFPMNYNFICGYVLSITTYALLMIQMMGT